jgi:hypothetical protein
MTRPSPAAERGKPVQHGGKGNQTGRATSKRGIMDTLPAATAARIGWGGTGGAVRARSACDEGTGADASILPNGSLSDSGLTSNEAGPQTEFHIRGNSRSIRSNSREMKRESASPARMIRE